jgi:hypothetical protein
MWRAGAMVMMGCGFVMVLRSWSTVAVCACFGQTHTMWPMSLIGSSNQEIIYVISKIGHCTLAQVEGCCQQWRWSLHSQNFSPERMSEGAEPACRATMRDMHACPHARNSRDRPPQANLRSGICTARSCQPLVQQQLFFAAGLQLLEARCTDTMT